MKSAILEKGQETYSYIGRIFNAIDNEQLRYNWLITDCECYPINKKYEDLFSKEYIWLTGEELTDIINEEDMQFIWGVFSGFPKENNLEEVLKYDLPFADGYEGFWIDDVGIQHPLASIEIVHWDSSLTLFISKHDDLVDKFRVSFPLSEDLAAQNTRDNSEINYIEKLLIEELGRRNIELNEKTLHQKYFIWNKLYSERKSLVKDQDIIICINKILDENLK
ncbi:hypothetical protein ACOAKC_00740 [Hathewaya histolytica]|uniref:hypothetical protein n=1 Tax=Hathewaya histolytica TaxID=1498 RepID=UPI003B6757C7